MRGPERRERKSERRGKSARVREGKRKRGGRECVKEGETVREGREVGAKERERGAARYFASGL